MAKRTRKGQKQCPKCKVWIKGTRTKTCPKCSYEFGGNQQAPAVAEAPAPAPAKASNTVSVEQVRAVAQTAKVIGGANRLNELLGLIREVGGVKKFKELLDAMTE